MKNQSLALCLSLALIGCQPSTDELISNLKQPTYTKEVFYSKEPIRIKNIQKAVNEDSVRVEKTIKQLTELGEEAITPLLNSLSIPDIRKPYVFQILGDIGSEKSYAPIESYITQVIITKNTRLGLSTDIESTVEAIRALSKINPEKSKPLLLEILFPEKSFYRVEPKLKQVIYESMQHWDSSAANDLKEILNSYPIPSKKQRIVTLNENVQKVFIALGQLGGEESSMILQEALFSGNYDSYTNDLFNGLLGTNEIDKIPIEKLHSMGQREVSRRNDFYVQLMLKRNDADFVLDLILEKYLSLRETSTSGAPVYNFGEFAVRSFELIGLSSFQKLINALSYDSSKNSSVNYLINAINVNNIEEIQENNIYFKLRLISDNIDINSPAQMAGIIQLFSYLTVRNKSKMTGESALLFSKAKALIIEELPKGEYVLQLSIIKALGDLGDEEDIEVLSPYLQQPKLFDEVVIALGKLNDKNILPDLAKVAQNSTFEYKVEAHRILSNYFTRESEKLAVEVLLNENNRKAQSRFVSNIMVDNKITLKALLIDQIKAKNRYDLVSSHYLPFREQEDILLTALKRNGTRDFAEFLVNNGGKLLREEAKRWAESRGYYIITRKLNHWTVNRKPK